ncbi:hypothetical protein NPX13_g3047 [Xylaria arbuscula]|uniref:Heterokaryon incompatibility domain-containing protein n=1 Tax=Xylaria arbuscula TaxID=114810 RepID=A0A9W8NI16_9PEZI|nr:hypothetical protein NPX13_g3047 [Xylaria arbuscula]
MDKWNSAIASLLYQPLKGELPLRLLLIHPGRGDEPLKTELVPTTLEESAGSYDATSYTWGSPEKPEKIDCGEHQLWVQRNAFHMMLDLRKIHEPRKVWIDAICINQCDLDERAAQVAIMHHIYRRAGAAWVWLGRPDEHSSAAMTYAAALDSKQFVKEFYDCQFGSNWSRFAEKSYFFDPAFDTSLDAKQTQDVVTAIVSFLNRPWFSRVWIQQEASLCQNVRVLCGLDVVDWDNIFALAWVMCPRYTETWPVYVHQQLSRTINNIQAVRIIQKSRHYYFQEHYGDTNIALGFEGLVENVSRYEATDPRDRIYAMGNIIVDSDLWFEVDYRIPWQILYADVARKFLDADALGFLKNAGRVRQHVDTALPSWAPDYRYKEESEYMLAGSSLWKAGGNSHPALITSAKASNIRVSQLPKGRRRQFPLSDELRNYKGPKKSLPQSFASLRWDRLDTNIPRIVKEIRKDIEYISTLDVPAYINGDSIQDAYKLTLIMSCDGQQELVRREYVTEHWDKWLNWYEEGCPGYWDGDNRKPVMNASFESSGAIITFRFAVTRHGYFCLVPRMTQVGDEVSIFQSYQFATVVRRVPQPTPSNTAKQGQKPATQDPYHELLGDAYVHGMMENEARCISDEFNCRPDPTQAQLDKMLKMSDAGRGEAWATLDLNGHYERTLETLGPRTIRLV